MSYPQNNLKKPCSECPFVKGAARGWLGPWSAEGLVRTVLSEYPFSCHQTVREDGQAPEETQHCVGSLALMRRSGKLPRDPELTRRMREVPPEILATVMDARQFVAHHQELESGTL